MTTQLDCSWGIGKETDYGTPVVPTRFLEADGALDVKFTTMQGKGLRAGTRVDLSARRGISKVEASGDLTVDVLTSGFGLILNAALGALTNTKIGTGPEYLQVHTLAKTDPVATYTIQQGTPLVGGGAVQPITFTGAVAESISLDLKVGEAVTAKVSWTARDGNTTQAYSAPSFPAAADLFTFIGAQVTLGTITAPTTTALASSTGTAAVNIRDLSITINQGYDKNGWNLGGYGRRNRRPVLGKATISGKMTAEYTDNALRDLYFSQQAVGLLLTLQGPVPYASGLFPTVQIAVPTIKLDGEIPKPAGGEAITQSIDFTGLDAAIGKEPVYVSYLSTDATP